MKRRNFIALLFSAPVGAAAGNSIGDCLYFTPEPFIRLLVRRDKGLIRSMYALGCFAGKKIKFDLSSLSYAVQGAESFAFRDTANPLGVCCDIPIKLLKTSRAGVFRLPDSTVRALKDGDAETANRLPLWILQAARDGCDLAIDPSKLRRS